MQKKDFLEYVYHLINEKSGAYYDEQEQFFYFYHKNIIFQIKSNQDAAFLVVCEDDRHKQNNVIISLTSDETIHFLKKILPLTPNNHQDYQQQKNQLGLDTFQHYVDSFSQYLKNQLSEKDIQQFCHKNTLEQYVFYFQINNIQHLCRLGKIAKGENKREHVLTSMIKIPVYFKENNSPKSYSIPYDFIIPSWEIEKFPILKNFIEPKIFGSDFHAIFDQIVTKFESGKELLKDFLDFNTPQNQKNHHFHKI